MAENRGKMRPHHNARSPPFVLIGLLVVIAILGFNYWSASSKNNQLLEEITSYSKKVNNVEEKSVQLASRNEVLLSKVKETDTEVDKLRSQLQSKDGELQQANTERTAKQAELESLKTELEKDDQEKRQLEEDLTTEREGRETERDQCEGQKQALRAALDNEKNAIPNCDSAVNDQRTKILDIVNKLWGNKAMMVLQQAGINIDGITVQEGDDGKNLPNKEKEQQNQGSSQNNLNENNEIQKLPRSDHGENIQQFGQSNGMNKQINEPIPYAPKQEVVGNEQRYNEKFPQPPSFNEAANQIQQPSENVNAQQGRESNAQQIPVAVPGNPHMPQNVQQPSENVNVQPFPQPPSFNEAANPIQQPSENVNAQQGMDPNAQQIPVAVPDNQPHMPQNGNIDQNVQGSQQGSLGTDQQQPPENGNFRGVAAPVGGSIVEGSQQNVQSSNQFNRQENVPANEQNVQSSNQFNRQENGPANDGLQVVKQDEGPAGAYAPQGGIAGNEGIAGRPGLANEGRPDSAQQPPDNNAPNGGLQPPQENQQIQQQINPPQGQAPEGNVNQAPVEGNAAAQGNEGNVLPPPEQPKDGLEPPQGNMNEAEQEDEREGDRNENAAREEDHDLKFQQLDRKEEMQKLEEEEKRIDNMQQEKEDDENNAEEDIDDNQDDDRREEEQ